MFFNFLVINFLVTIFRIGAVFGMGIVSFILTLLALDGSVGWSTVGLVFAAGFACLILAVVFTRIGETVDAI